MKLKDNIHIDNTYLHELVFVESQYLIPWFINFGITFVSKVVLRTFLLEIDKVYI